MRRRNAIARRGVEIDPHLDLRRQHLFLDFQIGQPRNLCQPLAQQAGLRPQGIEILTDDADGDLRPHAGEHVVDAVGNRLAEAKAGRQVLQTLADVGIDHLLGAATRFQLDLEFRHMHTLGVLVQLGPAGAPPHVFQFRQPAQGMFGRLGNADRLRQRRPRIEAQAEGDRAFVERRQESGREEGHGQRRQHHGHTSQGHR